MEYLLTVNSASATRPEPVSILSILMTTLKLEATAPVGDLLRLPSPNPTGSS